MQCTSRVFMIFSLLAALAVASLAGTKSPRNTTGTTLNAVEVIGHVQFQQGDTAKHMLPSDQGRKSYLYIQLASRPALVTVDVTHAAKPLIASEVALPAETSGAVVGNAVMPTESEGRGSVATPSTVTVMSFADPAHPKVVRQFDNVSGLLKDQARGLIYVVNDAGLWILHAAPSQDEKRLQQQYAHDVVYAH